MLGCTACPAEHELADQRATQEQLKQLRLRKLCSPERLIHIFFLATNPGFANITNPKMNDREICQFMDHNRYQIADIDSGVISWVNADLMTHILPCDPEQ